MSHPPRASLVRRALAAQGGEGTARSVGAWIVGHVGPKASPSPKEIGDVLRRLVASGSVEITPEGASRGNGNGGRDRSYRLVVRRST